MHPKLSVLVYLMFVSSFVASQTIVKNLPGYSGDLPFKLETGYVGVGDSENVQLFYYFFESERSPEEDPLVLWLTGGPGCSSFFGLAFEVGPVYFPDAKWKGSHVHDELPNLGLSPYSWTKFLNMIFLDAPVGAGFSYAKTLEAYQTGDSLQVGQTYEFLRKWLMAHPKFLKNPLYLSGDSFAGTIIPMIVQEITDGVEAGHHPVLNLKGYSLGNPVTDTDAEAWSRFEFAYQKALISKKLYESITANCKGNYNASGGTTNPLCQESLDEYAECTEKINVNNILEHSCYNFSEPLDLKVQPSWNLNQTLEKNFISLLRMVPHHRPFPRVPSCREQLQTYLFRVKTDGIKHNYMYLYHWANDPGVQEALHVRKGSVKLWVRCNASMHYLHEVSNALVYHQNLITKGYRIFIYSGDHDLSLPHTSTQAWIESLNLTVVDDWRPWFVDDEIAGYSMEYLGKKCRLTYATVKGAGHTAPEYKRKECFAMASRWFSHNSL